MSSDIRGAIGRTQLPVVRDVALALRVLQARRKTGFLMESRPGDFGSPIPSLNDVRARESEIFTVSTPAAIDLNEAVQLELVRSCAELYEDGLFDRGAQPGLRFSPDNDFFGWGCAFTLQCILRLHRPRRLIEVGSGYSSAVILDTNDRFLDGGLACTFIDPFPERLYGLLRDEDRARTRIITQPVQQVPLALFEELEAGDVLFIDSSHVSKVGSDVNRLVFDVFPRIRPGVYIHLHDFFFPFEYPKEWIYEGRAWNENYVLRSFLMFNASFEIVLFHSYLSQFHGAELATMPKWAASPGSSLWLRRVEDPGTAGPG